MTNRSSATAIAASNTVDSEAYVVIFDVQIQIQYSYDS